MQESHKETYDPEALQNLDNDFISIECLNKLGLDENPFIDHARDPFLFIDQQIEMSINVLMDYLNNQNSTLLLLGEIGIGKTTLLRLLLRKGYQEFNYCTLRAKDNSTFTEIEAKFKKRWRITKNDLNSEESSDKYITKFIESDKSPVLIIDDAHRLHANVLDDLLQLKHRVGLQSKKAMGLVLAAEPKIQSAINNLEQKNPAATHIFQINARAFDAKQCDNYINYRINKAGFKNAEFFTDEELKNLFNQSLGLPRIVNKLAREFITDKCKQSARIATPASEFKSTPGLRLGFILAGIIGLVFIVSSVFKFNSNKQEIEIDLKKPSENIEAAQPKTSNKKPDHKIVEVEKKSVKPKPKGIPKPYVAPLVLGPLVVETKNKTQSRPTQKIATTDKVEKPITSASEDSTSPKSPDWLLQQDPEAYTIQIVASPKQENLIQYANKWVANTSTAYYQKTVQGKEWFVLVQGIYPNRDQALDALQALPEKVQENQPYPQQLKNIQNLIQQ